MLLWFCLALLTVLLAWKMCALAGMADEQMEASYREMMKQEDENAG